MHDSLMHDMIQTPNFGFFTGLVWDFESEKSPRQPQRDLHGWTRLLVSRVRCQGIPVGLGRTRVWWSANDTV